MRKFISVKINNVAAFRKKLLHWANSFPVCCLLDSNGWNRNQHELLAAVDAVDETTISSHSFEKLKIFHQKKNDWLFGFLSYDLKNETEDLSSKNFDGIGFPQMHFFQPKYIFRFLPVLPDSASSDNNTEQKGEKTTSGPGQIEIGFLPEYSSEKEIENIVLEISGNPQVGDYKLQVCKINQRIQEEDYIRIVTKIREHIHRGDIYELNYCMEFFAKETYLNPAEVFRKLNLASQTPFSSFYQLRDKYLMCTSPERFLKKSGNKIISQPIKGTARRGENISEDNKIKKMFSQSKKEKSENVMIVDLVRNDLSKTCRNVQVEELFRISSFRQWHQMISTVSGEMDNGVHFVDVIKNAFPMGSMTGAPKVRAMELIEKYEETKRGLYSGAVGYFTPGRDFDFNVVIRSILYNSSSHYLSFQVGSAITADSIPENEYKECILKAKGMFEALGIHPPEKEKATFFPHVQGIY